jgi:hypothetical protein
LTCGMRRARIIFAGAIQPRLSRDGVLCYTARICSTSVSTDSLLKQVFRRASERLESFVCIDNVDVAVTDNAFFRQIHVVQLARPWAWRHLRHRDCRSNNLAWQLFNQKSWHAASSSREVR